MLWPQTDGGQVSGRFVDVVDKSPEICSGRKVSNRVGLANNNAVSRAAPGDDPGYAWESEVRRRKQAI